MPNLKTPTTGGVLAAVKAEVWIEGARRTDCFVTYSTDSEAEIVFQDSGFDSKMVSENDLVEIKVPRFGVTFRGYITNRISRLGDLVTYVALDYLSKLTDQFFLTDYNYRDEQDPEDIKREKTVREIATEVLDQYLSWQETHTPDDFLLDFDLGSFPDDLPPIGSTLVKSLNHLDGLIVILQQIDHRYGITVEHQTTKSVVKAFKLGEGTARKIVRGTDPDAAPNRQPHGTANVTKFVKQVNSSNTYSHCYATGDNRLVEQYWDLLLDYDLSNVSEVINNWGRFTVEKIANGAEEVDNPDFRKHLQRVCRYYSIPATVDLYDSETDESEQGVDDGIEGLIDRLHELPEDDRPEGEESSQVLIADRIVQTWEGKELKPFIAYKRVGDDEKIYAKFDGFSITPDSRKVIFDEPFVDKIEHLKIHGKDGAVVFYDSGLNLTEYSLSSKDPLDFITQAEIDSDDGVWFLVGSQMAHYKIKEVDDDDRLIVEGNLTGVGGNYILVNKRFQVWIAQAGAGETLGKYVMSGADDTVFTNEYAGFYLVLGTHDDTRLTAKPSDVESYKIAKNTAGALYVDTETDLTGKSAFFQIINPRTDTKREFEFIMLNAAYKSVQKLRHTTGDEGAAKNKKIIYQANTSFRWETEFKNLILVPDGETPEKFTVDFSGDYVDTIKEDDELEAWALAQLEGLTGYEVDLDITLPGFQAEINIGDLIHDNGVNSGCTVIARRLNYRTGEVSLRARNF